MKSIILLAALLGAANFSFAQDKAWTKSGEKNQDHIQMHEQMAKAHQQTADCLKSGKSEDECRKDFHDMCKEAGGPEKCGPWMMHHKMGKKAK
ncbi:MAG: hypothetical protein ACK5Y2_10715 [Bdellovibrionales bacterium]